MHAVALLERASGNEFFECFVPVHVDDLVPRLEIVDAAVNFSVYDAPAPYTSADASVCDDTEALSRAAPAFSERGHIPVVLYADRSAERAGELGCERRPLPCRKIRRVVDDPSGDDAGKTARGGFDRLFSRDLARERNERRYPLLRLLRRRDLADISYPIAERGRDPNRCSANVENGFHASIISSASAPHVKPRAPSPSPVSGSKHSRKPDFSRSATLFARMSAASFAKP